MGGHGGGNIDPNDLAMSYQNNYSGHSNGANGFSSGSALFADDELLDGLSPTEPQGNIAGQGQEFNGMNEMNMGYNQGMYQTMPMDQAHANGYSSTPDGDPIQSPFNRNFGPYRPIQHPQSFGNMYGEGNEGNETNYLNAKSRQMLSQAMQRKPSNTRSPMAPKSAMDSGFGAQPIQTSGARHEKTQSGQWVQTPPSMSSFPGSGFSSPPVGLHPAQISELLVKGGTSMPAKLGGGTALSSQEAKRKRRRESHNLVERRRRDNINERIQDLSKLVPAHRLEDEKIRKAIQNGTPLSPTLAGISSPSQATSGLAGPGAKRATSGIAGNITTGLPIEDKDKGPNKGDILNGAVSWTRDLMWMLNLKIQQQEELLNYIAELGGQMPFELTDDERRMQTELLEALTKTDEGQAAGAFSYTRTAGSGLRVPHHTDYKGEPLNGSGAHGTDHISISPGGDGAAGPEMEFVDFDDDGSGELLEDFKEEDEYGMDLTQ
ncbi:hypothetical protein GQ53DRAFT_662854 [Thozetella sp. PMI_491]|nr:hypothetical protein GQ53DRAFT_662854 [Thozetella sp. PMI_491]